MQNKRGKRGAGHSARRSFKPNANRFLNSVGKDERPAALRSSMPVTPNASTRSATAAVADSAIYFDGALVGESAEAHIVPRKSITERQYLGLLPQTAEYERLRGEQKDLLTGEVRDISRNRRTWRSDVTLLRRGNPFRGEERYKREGAIREGANTRNYVEVIPELPIEDATQLPKVVADDVTFDE